MIEQLLNIAPAPLVQILTTGGSVVAILLLLAFIVLTVFLVKCLQLCQNGLFFSSATRRTERLISTYKAEETSDYTQHNRVLEAETMTAAVISLLDAHKRRSASAEASRLFEQHRNNLRSHLWTIELIASLAPSLGLLGTVLGIIEAFQAMELAGREVDPSILSGGIWQALLTTAVGLSVAMPAILLLSWLNRRIESHLSKLDNLLTTLINQANADMEGSALSDKEKLGFHMVPSPSVRHAVV